MKRGDEQANLRNWEDVAPDLEQLIECVRRELTYRHRVYGRRVAAKRMSEGLAQREIRLMEHVLKNLVAQRVRK
jgi:hypothetical protein